MSTQIPKRGRPPVDSDLVRFRAERRVLDAIDAFAADQTPPLSRPEAVRVLVVEGLMREKLVPPIAEQIRELHQAYKERQGLLPHREDPEGAN